MHSIPTIGLAISHVPYAGDGYSEQRSVAILYVAQQYPNKRKVRSAISATSDFFVIFIIMYTGSESADEDC